MKEERNQTRGWIRNVIDHFHLSCSHLSGWGSLRCIALGGFGKYETGV